MPKIEESTGRLRHTAERVHPRCVVCSGTNTSGLALDFQVVNGYEVEALFVCDRRFEGYIDALHGGAITSILDGAMTNCLFAQEKTAVTAELRVRFRQPLAIGARATVRAWVIRSLGPLHELRAEIVQDDTVMASARGKFMEQQRSTDGPHGQTQRHGS